MTRIIPARFESLIEMLKRNSSFPTEPQLQSLHVAIALLHTSSTLCVNRAKSHICRPG